MKKWILGIVVLCFVVYMCDDDDVPEDQSATYTEQRTQDSDWLTSNEFVNNGSEFEMTLRLFKKGTMIMTVWASNGQKQSYEGTFKTEGNKLYISLYGASRESVFTIDETRHQIYAVDGSCYTIR